MMLLKNVYTSIDIGSDSIKVVVCELHNNKLNLLATSSVKSKGIKKGLIVNADDAQASIKEAMEEIESLLGIKINKVIASVPANNAEFTFIKGEVKIINENKEFLGGAISPGIMTSLSTMISSAAKLSDINMASPHSVIGNDTQSCIQSGIIYGFASMIDGMIEKIKKELKLNNIKVYLTGGLASTIKSYLSINSFSFL